MIRLRTKTGEETLDLAEFEVCVSRGEIPPDALICFPVVTGEHFVPARELEIFRGLYNPSRIYFTRYFNLATFPTLTTAIILANVIVFVIGRASAGSASTHITAELVRQGAKAGPLITDLGESWRLLTANFVHRDWLHLGFNLFFFFNVGGALENTYRRFDYFLIVLVSGLGTTLLSFAGSSSISAGASGIVFGCLGGVVVFGLKYREIIPPRYRRFFGGSVMPYLLVFLALGWMSSGIDNWGHLGGLTGGTVTTLLLRPRLLDAGTDLVHRRALRVAFAGGLLLLTLLAGPLWVRFGAPLQVERDDDLGFEVAHPLGWRRAITSLGQLGFSNGLPEPTYLQPIADTRSGRFTLESVADEWFTLQLESKEHAGLVRGVRREPPRKVEIAGLPGLFYRAAFETVLQDARGTAYVMDLLVFARGEVAFTLVMLAPRSRFARYRSIFDRIVASIHLTEPRHLRQARAAVLLDPDDLEARLRLAEAFRQSGDPRRAARGYEEVLARDPTERSAHLALSRLFLDRPDRQERGRLLLEGLIDETHDPGERVELLLLSLRYLQQAGRREEARARLHELRALAPDDPRLPPIAHDLAEDTP